MIKKDATVSYEGRLFEVPFEFVGETIYLVVDAPTQTAKYIESLNHEWLGHVHPLDKIANNYRRRHRPKSISDIPPTTKTSLVEELYQQNNHQFNTTGEK